MFFSLRLYLCGCWVKATTVAERPRIAEGGEGQRYLHVGCWAARSVVSLTRPLACGMEAASSCMPVVRAGPTRPQLFLSSSLTLFHFLALFLSLFLSLFHIQLPFRVIKYLEMQWKHTVRWKVWGKLSLKGKISRFTLPSPLISPQSYFTQKNNLYLILHLYSHCSHIIIYYELNNFLTLTYLFHILSVLDYARLIFSLAGCNITLTQEYLSIFSLVVNCSGDGNA